MISVILPTIRPHLIASALSSLMASASTVPIEVVVVADFHPPEDYGNVRWLMEPRNGVVAAINAGYRLAVGEYIFLTNDETTYGAECLDLMMAAARARPCSLLMPTHFPKFNFVYYGKPFAPFLFAHRDLIERIGGGWLFDPSYKAFYADPDLSLRADAAGIPVHIVEGANIYHKQGHTEDHRLAVNRYFDNDRATFRARWDHLGEFCDPR